MNSIEEITDSLGSLSQFRNLAKKRHHAGYDQNQELNEFVVLKGRFYLDSCGNLSKVIELSGDTSQVGNVMTRKDFYKSLGENGSMTSTPAPVPTETDTCSVCRKPWDISTCHDYVVTGNFGYHERCLYLKTAKEDFSCFQSLFELAGFEPSVFTAIPNGYWGEGKWYATPWYKVETPFGVIRIGWRKRVINIDWGATGKDFKVFFHKEDVTKWEHGIHAWGFAKAAEYLGALRSLLSMTTEALERTRISVEKEAREKVTAYES